MLFITFNGSFLSHLRTALTNRNKTNRHEVLSKFFFRSIKRLFAEFHFLLFILSSIKFNFILKSSVNYAVFIFRYSTVYLTKFTVILSNILCIRSDFTSIFTFNLLAIRSHGIFPRHTNALVSLFCIIPLSGSSRLAWPHETIDSDSHKLHSGLNKNFSFDEVSK